MGFFKILSKPISNKAPVNYKGLYRSEPFPQSEEDEEFLSLWDRYASYYEPLHNLGITIELTFDEIKYFSNLATNQIGDNFEIIFFNEIKDCPYESEYYGIDVIGIGGYSIIGEGLFNVSKKSILFCLMDVLTRYFNNKLNCNYLFDSVDDALSFRSILKELDELKPGSIESEDWRIVHVFKVK